MPTETEGSDGALLARGRLATTTDADHHVLSLVGNSSSEHVGQSVGSGGGAIRAHFGRALIYKICGFCWTGR